MSQVHDAIALAALSVQKKEIREAFKPYIEDLVKSSWYPDRVKAIKKTKDARFLGPDAPKTSWHKKLKAISQKNKFWVCCGQPTLEDTHLCGYYLKTIIRHLRVGDIKSAVKYCGVYSHVIADTIEPGHAVFDWAIDIFAPVSFYNASSEIFTNKECLRGPVNIRGYRPKLLGENIKRAEVGAIADLIAGSRFGSSLAIPMEGALYSGKIKKATQFACRAHNDSAKRFADFIHTVFHLAEQNKKSSDCPLDLCNHPFISTEVSCHCRFRPIVDAFLDPSCFDETDFDSYAIGTFILKPKPLAILSKDKGKIETVHGFCVKPTGISSEATVDYLLAPGAYSKFSSRVGFNPTFKKLLPFLSAVFSVIGDGKVLARSKPVRVGQAAVPLRAELGRTRFLTLSMKYSGSYSSKDKEQFERGFSASHGVWAEPVLY